MNKCDCENGYSLTQFIGNLISMALVIAYCIAQTHPEVDVPMVDETITHHNIEDIPVLDEDGL